MSRQLVLIRGGGDIATGIAHRLFKSGYSVVITEIEKPTAIRRTASFAQAMIDGEITIEDVTAVKVYDADEIGQALKQKKIAIIIDETGDVIEKINPDVVVDAILAKKNLGTDISMAKIVIGVGPGFEAKKDVHAVIETNRGHHLGKVITNGKAQTDTGIPANIKGHTYDRVIRAKNDGKIKHNAKIGDKVESGQVIAFVGEQEVKAKISGILRGLIQTCIYVDENAKIADIDPRGEREYCFSISDKARAVAGGVLEAIMYLEKD
ncbi:MAG: molybdenum hydroxylase [Alkaliphilus sp.]|nr:EF2563 family selenium-dependent molybdenum hydroxylase system protein [bacterium AH-315-L21]PHS34795.1 MAG: molybdenum hydroxylase [Alkaliphilus sp.]